jgi:hypothetical protein
MVNQHNLISRQLHILFERLFISHKIYKHNIHCQGLSRSISSPTNIALLKYSGDDVAREEQNSKTEQEETKKNNNNKKTKKQQQHFDVRGPWDRHCSPSTIVDKNLLDNYT